MRTTDRRGFISHSMSDSVGTMQCLRTGWTVRFLCCCVLIITGPLPVENMDGTSPEAPKQYVNQSHSLCPGEQEYILKRKQIVLEALNRLGINCTPESVPHIALMGSGGGQRAAVSLLGFLYQMGQNDLLDTLLYLGAVSGTTWSMPLLYSDPEWSSNMDSVLSKLSGPGVGLGEAVAWLKERAKKEDFSLSDVWGVITSAGIMKQMDVRRLSDEAGRNATNPYPIYCAMEKDCFTDGPLEGTWFDVTPHEAGFTELDLFINTSLLGSVFQRGELKEERPEMDMIELQGVLGCALADEETLKGLMPSWMNVPGQVDSAAVTYLRVYHTLLGLVALMTNNMEDPTVLTELSQLKKTLDDKLNHDQSTLLETKSPEEREAMFKLWTVGLLGALKTWSQTLEEGPFKEQVSWLSRHVVPLIEKWEWGTTRNFLFQHPDPVVPPCLHSRDRIHLIDAGLLINVPYPPLLGDKRDIDLMIAPEYSAGNMFETLTLARDYAAKLKKPFPAIDENVLKEKDWPKDCYVFDGEHNQPTIVFMPLFNQKNCKDAEEVSEKMKEYATFQLPFDQEKIDFLIQTAKTSMENNKDVILREIQKAVQRRHNKRKSGESDL